jgi:hypothetical protein
VRRHAARTGAARRTQPAAASVCVTRCACTHRRIHEPPARHQDRVRRPGLFNEGQRRANTRHNGGGYCRASGVVHGRSAGCKQRARTHGVRIALPGTLPPTWVHLATPTDPADVDPWSCPHRS